MDAAIIIRAATLADIAAITEIYRPEVLSGTATFEMVPPDEAEMARRHAAIVAFADSLKRRTDAPDRASQEEAENA